MLTVKRTDTTTSPPREWDQVRADRVSLREGWAMVYSPGEKIPTAYDLSNWRLEVTAS